jgi:mono/diheme cytochrome c family protein
VVLISNEKETRMADGKTFDPKRHLPSVAFTVIVLAAIAAFAGIFIYAGVYNIGADAPHSRLVYNVLQELRERAVSSYAHGIKPPADLNDPKRIAAGAGLYNEMCTGCHLGPGIEKSEMSQGLYPAAPELARGDDLSPAEQFWVIKHGVKLTAMPAWGKTHDDQLIWDMVAFIRQLPKISAQQYQAAVASAPESHEEMMTDMPGRHETGSETQRDAEEHEHAHTHDQ